MDPWMCVYDIYLVVDLDDRALKSLTTLCIKLFPYTAEKGERKIYKCTHNRSNECITMSLVIVTGWNAHGHIRPIEVIVLEW